MSITIAVSVALKRLYENVVPENSLLIHSDKSPDD